MVALSRETIYGLIAVGVAIMLLVFIFARYGSLSPCEMLRQDLIRGAEKRGESVVATQLVFQELRPRIDAGTCLGAYLSFAPSTYIRQF